MQCTPALVYLCLVCAKIAQADDSSLKSAVIGAIQKHYYREISPEDLRKNSLSSILQLLDKDSSLIEQPRKELDYVRGFKKRASFLKSRLLEEKIGYLQIGFFSGSIEREFAREYRELKTQGAKKMVIDLRRNSGGDFNCARRIAELFVPSGERIAVLRKRERQHYFRSENNKPFSEPLVVLVDSATASSAEFLAMTLRKQGARIVGVPTQGKNTLQEFFPVEKQWLCLTVGTWQKPNGTSEEKHLTPEFLVSGESEQLKKAVELLKND